MGTPGVRFFITGPAARGPARGSRVSPSVDDVLLGRRTSYPFSGSVWRSCLRRYACIQYDGRAAGTVARRLNFWPSTGESSSEVEVPFPFPGISVFSLACDSLPGRNGLFLILRTPHARRGEEALRAISELNGDLGEMHRGNPGSLSLVNSAHATGQEAWSDFTC